MSSGQQVPAVTLPPTFVAENNGAVDTQFAITFFSTAQREPAQCGMVLRETQAATGASSSEVCFAGPAPLAYMCPRACGVGK